MEKNTLLAMFLSAIVIIAWSWLIPTLDPPVVPPQKSSTSTEETAEAMVSSNETAIGSSGMSDLETSVLSSAPKAPDETLEAKEIVVETDYYRAVIDTRGGVLTSLLLNNYQHFKSRVTLAEWIPFLEGILGKTRPDTNTERNQVQMIKRSLQNQLQTLDIQFKENPELAERFRKTVFASNEESIFIEKEGNSKQLILTSPVISGIQVVKTLTFYPESFVIDYDVDIVNRNDATQPISIRHIFGEGRLPDFPGQALGYVHVGPMYAVGGDIETEDTDDLDEGPITMKNMQWLGIADYYFIAAAAAQTTYKNGFFEALPRVFQGQQNWEAYFGISLPPTDLLPNKMVESNFKLYYGPKDVTEMEKFGNDLPLSFDLTLEEIAGPLLQLLLWIESHVGNYGVAIIILTIIVRLVLFPLTYRGSKSMKRMQQLQPRIKKLQEKYKNNREKLGQEMMALYKKHKVNPVGGCLPMLLQLPIFFGLYSALSTAVELRHAPFYGWIQDLAAPDGLGITPILMGISMYFMQKMTPTGMMDPNHVKIMQMLPIIFTVFTFTFPSGLVLYWVTSNVLSLGQQYLINRIKVPDFAD